MKKKLCKNFFFFYSGKTIRYSWIRIRNNFEMLDMDPYKRIPDPKPCFKHWEFGCVAFNMLGMGTVRVKNENLKVSPRKIFEKKKAKSAKFRPERTSANCTFAIGSSQCGGRKVQRETLLQSLCIVCFGQNEIVISFVFIKLVILYTFQVRV